MQYACTLQLMGGMLQKLPGATQRQALAHREGPVSSWCVRQMLQCLAVTSTNRMCALLCRCIDALRQLETAESRTHPAVGLLAMQAFLAAGNVQQAEMEAAGTRSEPLSILLLTTGSFPGCCT